MTDRRGSPGRYDVTVIGGGPAGLAAAAAADRAGAKTLLVEREERLGGILKQCIHDGFGLVRFGEKLSGPEYARRGMDELEKTAVQTRLRTFVTRALKEGDGFAVTLVGAGGLDTIRTGALVLATGCRERTARQAAIHGSRPAGVLTAGTAQYYTNILGRLPARRCVILGSGDIGLIMARRLYLEGAEVAGVYEAKSTPSGLSRNIAQCLDDFGIPLHTGRTVTRVFGRGRLEAVEIMAVDEALRPLPGTEERIHCDGLILSVGLIPENELAESLGVPLHPATRGPVCDQRYHTGVEGIFSCGNALQVNDLVDYVSESGETAGRNAALYAAGGGGPAGGSGGDGGKPDRGSGGGGERNFAEFLAGEGFLCMTPQRLDLDHLEEETTVFFRSRNDRGKTLVRIGAGGRELFAKRYNQLRPPEMERITLRLKDAGLRKGDRIQCAMEAGG
ncbi:MAG: NAD(P)/FAD-dependent oxidoreductase [Treponema sp.]|jgi:thioredoxin reductase|nr:NAD(P)/FAD-dependent oxidoreductase [Treponema sp.]